jgi:hypothetical protein
MRKRTRSFDFSEKAFVARTHHRRGLVLSMFVALLATMLCSAFSAPMIRIKQPASRASANVRQYSGQQLELTQLQIARRGHSATALEDGRILVVGGENSSGAVSESEIFNASTNTFSLGAKSLVARADHAAVLLDDGRVLIVGGRNGDQPLLSTEIFDPSSNSFSKGPALNRPRSGHTGTVLSDGKYLVLGGDAEGSAEIFDPATQSFILLHTHMSMARSFQGAALLMDGNVLIAGGLGFDGNPVSTAEIFDPQTMSFSPASNEMHVPRTSPTLRVLPDGKVQVIGGDDESTMEMFNFEGTRFTAYAHLGTTTELIGKTLRSASVVGLFRLSQGKSKSLQSAASVTWKEASPAISGVTDRTGQSVTEVPGTNMILVAGGRTSAASALASTALLASSPGVTVTSDKTDYHPGETIFITGSGFQPGETVQLQLTRDPKTSPDTVLTPSVADTSGNFVNSSYVVLQTDLGVTFTLTATGQTSNLVAQTNFTDVSCLFCVTCSTVRTGEVGAFFNSPAPTVTGGSTPYTFSIVGGLTNLPAGLTLNADGSITGTPTATGTFTLQVTDAKLHVATTTCPFTIIAGPSLDCSSTTSSGEAGVPFNSAAPTVTGGTAPYTFSVATGSLNGLLLDASTGTITGTPTAAGAFTIKVTDFKGAVATATCPFTIIAGPSLDCSSTTSSGEAGVPFNSAAPTVTGGTAPYTFSVATGSLNGLLLDASTGAITGTPTAAGAFTIKVTDFKGAVATATCPFRIIAGPSLDCSNTTTSGEAGVPFNSAAPTVTGGTAPYNFSVATGSLNGLLLDASTGAITGTPTAAGSFSIKVTDFKGAVAAATCPITIIAGPSLDCSSTTTSGEAGVPFNSAAPTVTGGTAPYTFTVVGTLPNGLTLNTSTGAITGTPTAAGAFTIKVTDFKGAVAAATCPFTIIAGPSLDCSSTTSSGEAGVPFNSAAPTVTGGTAPYTFTVVGTLPAGLTLNASTGAITGTPTAAGAFTIQVKDAKGVVAVGTCPCIIVAAPVLTCSATNSGEVSVPFNSPAMAVTGGVSPYTFTVVGTLPAGLTLNASTGAITGTPTASGTFSIKVADANGVVATGSNCPFTIVDKPSVTCSATNSGEVGVAFNSPAMIVTGGVSPYTYAVVGTLPGGLTLNASTGAISGTPTASGTFSIKVTDANGVVATGSNCPFTIVAAPSVTCSATNSGEVSVAFNSPAMTVTGGVSPYTFTVVGTLPGGLTLNASTGAITGAPTASGTFSIKVTDANGVVATGSNCPFTINPAPTGACVSITAVQGVAVTPVKMPAGSGGTKPYTYAATGLPTGLVMAIDGTISGTPTVTGTFTYTVTVTDSAGGKGTSKCTVTVYPPITSSCVVINAIRGVAITPVTMTASAGTGAGYTFTATGLPAGLSISSTGTISGTPTVTGTFPYIVTITDSAGDKSIFNCSVTVYPPITASCVSITAAQGVAITPVTMTASGGTGTGYTFTATGLPAGLSISAGGTIAGTPTAGGTYPYTVTVKDSAGNTGTVNCSVTVNPKPVPGIQIVKTASPTMAVFGQQVTFTYVVTNTGNVALTNVKVVDDNGTPSWTSDDFTVGTVALLAPGASQTFTSTRIPPAPVCSSGSGGSGGGCGQLITEHRSDGKTKFTYLQAEDSRDSYQSWFGWSGSRSHGHYAHMRIYDKNGNTNQDVDATPGAGDGSQYFNSFSCLVDKSAVVKSDGCSVNLPDIFEKKGWNKDWHLDWDWGWGDSNRQHYWDDSYSGHNLDWDSNEHPDECPGTSINTAKVTASWSGGTVSATDDASVNLVAKLTPKVSITKTADTTQAAPGAKVTYTYVVTNTGGLTLTNLVVVDDNGTPTITADDITVGTVPSLNPGQSVTLTRTLVPPTPVCDSGGGCGMLITQHLGNGSTKFTYMQVKDDRDSYQTYSGWLGSRSHAHWAKIRVYDKTGATHQDIDSTPGSGDGSSYINSFSVVVNTASVVKSDGCSVNLPDVFHKKGWDGDWRQDWDRAAGDYNRVHYWDDSYTGHTPSWDYSSNPDICSGTVTNIAKVTASSTGGTVSATDDATVNIVAPTPLAQGDTATIGFWHNKNGQALILALNGGGSSTKLGDWLAANFPCLYGSLAGKQNSVVAAQFLTYFSVTGQKTYAEIMAGALASYATSSALAGDNTAAGYGFNVSSTGTGAKTYNVGSNGTAIGLANNTSHTVLQLLQAANGKCPFGTSGTVFDALNTIFDGINTTGDIQ